MGARWRSPSGEQWEIASGEHRATIVEVGGGLRSYGVAGRDVVAGYGPDVLPPHGAGAVLAPWPNRLGDGRYELDGADRQLALSEPALGNAIHGLTRWLPWRRADHTPESVTVCCTLAPQPGYPRALELVTRWTVGPAGLSAEHTVANLGSLPAPFGLGTHPYLVAADDVALTLPAAVRLLVDERKLPTGVEPVDGTPYDFRGGAPIGSIELDTAFTELSRSDDGRATVEVRSAAGAVRVWMDGAFGWVQVFRGGSPAGSGTAVAVEPMTCPPDAFRTGTDLLVLGGGERWHGTWGITPLR